MRDEAREGSLSILHHDGSTEPVKTYTLEPVDAPDVPEDVPQGWHIEDLGGLAWAMERISANAKTRAENEALAEQAMARIQGWLAAVNGPLDRNDEYFTGQIRSYCESHREDICKGKKKSRELPTGTVGFRKSGGGLVVVDEDAALDWAKAQDDLSLVRVKVELSKTALRDRFKTDGAIPPGCDVEPESETFYIKPAAPLLPGIPAAKELPEGK